MGNLLLKPVSGWAGLRRSVHRLGACVSDMYNNNHTAPTQGAEMMMIPWRCDIQREGWGTIQFLWVSRKTDDQRQDLKDYHLYMHNPNVTIWDKTQIFLKFNNATNRMNRSDSDTYVFLFHYFPAKEQYFIQKFQDYEMDSSWQHV